MANKSSRRTRPFSRSPDRTSSPVRKSSDSASPVAACTSPRPRFLAISASWDSCAFPWKAARATSGRAPWRTRRSPPSKRSFPAVLECVRRRRVGRAPYRRLRRPADFRGHRRRGVARDPRDDRRREHDPCRLPVGRAAARPSSPDSPGSPARAEQEPATRSRRSRTAELSCIDGRAEQ